MARLTQQFDLNLLESLRHRTDGDRTAGDADDLIKNVGALSSNK